MSSSKLNKRRPTDKEGSTGTDEETEALAASSGASSSDSKKGDSTTKMGASKQADGGSGAGAVSSSFRIMLLICMVIQNSAVVLVGRYTRSSTPKDEMFVVSQFLLMTELSKLLGSFVLEAYTSGNLLRSLRDNVISNPKDSLKISVPALLYLLQNSLLYVALTNLSAPLFQVTYQTKLLTTALVSVVMLKRKYSLQQWICLATLGVGVAIVVLGENGKKGDDAKEGEDGGAAGTDDNKPVQNVATGLIAVTIACFSSAFAGVYFEKVVKGAGGGGPAIPVSLWMRNIQLAFFSVVIAFGQHVYQQNQPDGDEDGDKPFLHGFNFWVWILMLLQAGGGLLIAAIIKYADNVLKGLATGVAVAVSTFCSMVLFGTPLTAQFTVGATVILTSVYFFSNGGTKKTPSPQEAKAAGDVELNDAESGKPLIADKK